MYLTKALHPHSDSTGLGLTSSLPKIEGDPFTGKPRRTTMEHSRQMLRKPQDMISLTSHQPRLVQFCSLPLTWNWRLGTQTVWKLRACFTVGPTPNSPRGQDPQQRQKPAGAVIGSSSWNGQVMDVRMLNDPVEGEEQEDPGHSWGCFPHWLGYCRLQLIVSFPVLIFSGSYYYSYEQLEDHSMVFRLVFKASPP